jgi:hypothetical protein
MTKKKNIALSVLGLLLLFLISTVVAWVLIGRRPEWYKPPKQRSREELLAAETRMISTGAKFKNKSQVNAPFILELTEDQINDMLAVVMDRRPILPDYIAYPVISFSDGVAFAAATVTFKGQTSVVSVRIKPFVDADGLLHIELDNLRAGALGLPDNFLSKAIRDIEKSVTARLDWSTSRTAQAEAARKNKDLLARIFTALSGTPVLANFVTRKDLQMAIDGIRVSPGLLEIKFKPLPIETSAE